MVDTTCTKLVAEFISGSETKICDSDPKTIEAEDVLRLQISVINPQSDNIPQLRGIEGKYP